MGDKPRYAIGDTVQINAPASGYHGWTGRIVNLDPDEDFTSMVELTWPRGHTTTCPFKESELQRTAVDQLGDLVR